MHHNNPCSVNTDATLFVNEFSEDLQKQIWRNAVLCGGNSKVDGFDRRFERELSKYDDNAKVVGGKHDGFEIWCGGSILALLTGFIKQWIPNHEYDEIGPDIVHCHCF